MWKMQMHNDRDEAQSWPCRHSCPLTVTAHRAGANRGKQHRVLTVKPPCWGRSRDYALFFRWWNIMEGNIPAL